MGLVGVGKRSGTVVISIRFGQWSAAEANMQDAGREQCDPRPKTDSDRSVDSIFVRACILAKHSAVK